MSFVAEWDETLELLLERLADEIQAEADDTGVTSEAGPVPAAAAGPARTAVNIAAIAEAPLEAEVLFRPGTRFTVLDVWDLGGQSVPRRAPFEVQLMMHQVRPPYGRTGKVIELAEASTGIATGPDRPRAMNRWPGTSSPQSMSNERIIDRPSRAGPRAGTGMRTIVAKGPSARDSIFSSRTPVRRSGAGGVGLGANK